MKMIKKKYEEQKQKELEVKNFINKDKIFFNNFNTEMKNIVNELNSKDKEIKEIRENMTKWKNETLNKLADKFENELNKQLDK